MCKGTYSANVSALVGGTTWMMTSTSMTRTVTCLPLRFKTMSIIYKFLHTGLPAYFSPHLTHVAFQVNTRLLYSRSSFCPNSIMIQTKAKHTFSGCISTITISTQPVCNLDYERFPSKVSGLVLSHLIIRLTENKRNTSLN